MTKGWKKESARHALASKGIKTGIKVEMEHAKTIRKIKEKNLSIKQAATEIAKDHLKEDPNYYKKLAIVESDKGETLDTGMKVSELLPEFDGEEIGALTLGELKIADPRLYEQIKHWEELGEGFERFLKAKGHKRAGSKGKTTPKTAKAIQGRINELLFNPQKNQTDPELLEITIRADKIHYLNFLKGYTEWQTKGRWHKLDEENQLLEIQFRDTPDERVGNELMKLLTAYNRKVIKEKVLYARTVPLEETTLKA